MMGSLNNVTVVIRSVRERTESICRKLILKQGLPEEAVFVTHESPFSKTLASSFQIGMDQDRPWTLCVDADVITRKDSIRQMVELAEYQPENTCEIQGYVLDKFFGGPRTAGNHLYRTALLDRALELIPDEGTAIRPEHHMLSAMQRSGFPWVIVRCLVGIHDDEQYYRDIFRKAFVQAHKHSDFCSLFLEHWRQQAAHDPDYEVALAGFAAGVKYRGTVRIDVTDRVFTVNLKEVGLDEKGPLSDSEWTFPRIEKTIQEWEEPAIYHKRLPSRAGLDQPKSLLNRLSLRNPPDPNASRLKKVLVHACNLILLVPWIFGKILVRLGYKIQTVVRID